MSADERRSCKLQRVRENPVARPPRARGSAVPEEEIGLDSRCSRRAVSRYLCVVLLPLLQLLHHELERVVGLASESSSRSQSTRSRRKAGNPANSADKAYLCLEQLGRNVLEHDPDVALIHPLQRIVLGLLRVLPVLCRNGA